MKRIAFIFIFLWCALLGFAQNVEFDTQNFPDKKQRKEALQFVNKGDKHFNTKSPNYADALENYKKAYEINPNNALLNYKIGKCISSFNKKDGLKYFASANLLLKSANAELDVIQDNMLLYATSLHYQYKFDSAVIMYRNWLDLIANNKIVKHEQTDVVKKYIAQCLTGDSLMRYPTRYVVAKLGSAINSEYYEFAPVPFFDTLAFNSYKPVQALKSKKNAPAVSTIYISKKNKDGSFLEAKCMEEPFLSPFNDIITDFSPSGKYALVSRDGDIYYSIQGKNGKWLNLTPLDNNVNTASNEIYACFSKDMNYLYFASNCAGGYGGYDIYRVNLTVGKSGELRCSGRKNLGKNVNSAYDEVSVSFSNFNNNMYISSNCEKSMGGFDIFKSFPEADGWSPLINMGFPLNSTDSEMHFVRSNNHKSAYFTKSDENHNTDIYSVDIVDVENVVLIKEIENKLRQTSTDDDIIVFGFEDELKISSYVMCTVKGHIRDAYDFSPLSLKVDVIDNKTLGVVASFETLPSNGMFSITLPSGESYGLVLKDSEYMFCSQEIAINGSSTYKVIEENIYIPKTEPDKVILLENISFVRDSDRFNNDKSQGELFRIYRVLQDHPSLNVEIVGRLTHTSKILAHLVRSGIAQERISTKPPERSMRGNIAVRFF